MRFYRFFTHQLCSFLAVIGFWGIGALWATANAQYPERTVEFSEDFSVGIATSRPWNSTDAEDWVTLGAATGKIVVPAGHMLGVVVPPYAAYQLQFLSKLDPMAIQDLNLTSLQVTENDLKAIGQMTGLRSLHLPITPILDDWLVHLSGLHDLEYLDVSQTKIEGRGFASLAGLSKLRSLVASSTPITDPGVEGIVQIKSLEYVGLVFCYIGPEGFKKIASLPNLKQLDLNRVLDPSICDILSTSASLELIYMHASDGVTDGAMLALSKMPRLKFLLVNSNAVTDTGLLAFKDSTSIQKLMLIRSKTTLDGAKQFKQSKPDCILFR